jgi:hypothetical protein
MRGEAMGAVTVALAGEVVGTDDAAVVAAGLAGAVLTGAGGDVSLGIWFNPPSDWRGANAEYVLLNAAVARDSRLIAG